MSGILVLLFFCSAASFCEAVVPAILSRQEASLKMKEILQLHISYSTLSEEIVSRALSAYLEEIDPFCEYLLESEARLWTSPSREFLQSVLREFEEGNFASFYALHDLFVQAVLRRRALASEIHFLPPDALRNEDARTSSRAESEEELKSRLIKKHKELLDVIASLNTEDQASFLRKKARKIEFQEQKLMGDSEEKKERTILTFILRSISSSLDSHTAYLTPAEVYELTGRLERERYGIGAEVREELNGLSIVRLLKGGPAETGGLLKAGDLIVEVNGESIIGMDLAEMVSLIQGPQQTPVTLSVLKDSGEKIEITVIRGPVREEGPSSAASISSSQAPVSYRILPDRSIGIINLTSFYQGDRSSAVSDLTHILRICKRETVRGIILDLRNNLGGLLGQAVGVAGLFLSGDIALCFQGNTQDVEYYRGKNTDVEWSGPLLLLTNRSSASASEIVSQTLQEYGRALVVGDPETFGKGTYQHISFSIESARRGEVDPRGEFKVTRGRYYTSSGKSPQLTGVEADIVIPGPLFQSPTGERYAKYPISENQIDPEFGTGFDPAPSVPSYLFRIKELKINSEKRIADNALYQSCIKEKNNRLEELQLEETIEVMTDLISLFERFPD